jgi:hypothetical protein
MKLLGGNASASWTRVTEPITTASAVKKGAEREETLDFAMVSLRPRDADGCVLFGERVAEGGALDRKHHQHEHEEWGHRDRDSHQQEDDAEPLPTAGERVAERKDRKEYGGQEARSQD